MGISKTSEKIKQLTKLEKCVLKFSRTLDIFFWFILGLIVIFSLMVNIYFCVDSGLLGIALMGVKLIKIIILISVIGILLRIISAVIRIKVKFIKERVTRKKEFVEEIREALKLGGRKR